MPVRPSPGHPGVLRLQDFVINTDVIVLSTPEIAGLPYVISGLVAAGGLAAALSTADGLLLAIANALSHDIYYKMITPLRPAPRYTVVGVLALAIVGIIAYFLTGPSVVYLTASWLPDAVRIGAVPWNWLLLVTLGVTLLIVMPFWFGATETAKRLIVARVLLLFVAIAAAATASTRPSDILAMVGWAFSLAMAGNFPALVMGIWWKRTTTAAAIWGMIAGFSLCVFYLVVTRYLPGIGVKYFGMTSLLEPDHWSAAGRYRQGDGSTQRHGQLPDARAPAGQQGRLVQPQQHQLRDAGRTTRLPGDLRGELLHQAAVGGDDGLRRRDP